MVDDELWMCERKLWLDGASFHKERVARDALLLPAARSLPRRLDANPDDALTERGALALFFAD
jgi:hypothetical protein